MELAEVLLWGHKAPIAFMELPDAHSQRDVAFDVFDAPFGSPVVKGVMTPGCRMEVDDGSLRQGAGKACTNECGGSVRLPTGFLCTQGGTDEIWKKRMMWLPCKRSRSVDLEDGRISSSSTEGP